MTCRTDVLALTLCQAVSQVLARHLNKPQQVLHHLWMICCHVVALADIIDQMIECLLCLRLDILPRLPILTWRFQLAIRMREVQFPGTVPYRVQFSPPVKVESFPR